MKDCAESGSALSSVQEDYLEALWQLGGRHGRGVTLTALAQHLGISAASASDVVQRLQAGALVARAPRGAIMLTPAGRGCAARVAARHSLLKRFFTALLGVPDAIAEQDACRVEHALHPDTCQRLKGFVARYAQDRPGAADVVPLAQMRRGWSGRVVAVGGGAARLRLARLGVCVGADITVLQNRGRGPVMVRVGNSRVAVGRGLAARLYLTITHGSQGIA